MDMKISKELNVSTKHGDMFEVIHCIWKIVLPHYNRTVDCLDILSVVTVSSYKKYLAFQHFTI